MLPSNLALSPTGLHGDQRSLGPAGRSPRRPQLLRTKGKQPASCPRHPQEQPEGCSKSEDNSYALCPGAHLWKCRFGSDGHGETGDAGVGNPGMEGMAENPTVLTPASGVRHRSKSASKYVMWLLNMAESTEFGEIRSKFSYQRHFQTPQRVLRKALG